jgi:hypothetical protein
LKWKPQIALQTGNKRTGGAVTQSEEKHMNTRKSLIIVGLVLAIASMLPVAQADELDQVTEVTFNQSVQIPGRTLPAGTYWFVRAYTSTGQRNLIRIFNSDRSVLYATVSTITTTRAKRTDKTALTFGEQDASQPKAILTWFYPGRETGHEFVYQKQEQRDLARGRQETVVAGD